MPPFENLFYAAYLDSPVFNLDDGSLWVSDVQNDRVLRMLDVCPQSPSAKRIGGAKFSKDKEKTDPADFVMAPPAPIRAPSGRARGLAFDQRGRLVMCESGGRRVTRLEKDSTLTVLVEKIDNKRFNSPDDVVLDSKGRIYFTDPRFGNREDMDMPTEGVYRIDVDEYQRIALSPDESKLYLVEAHPSASRLVVFELNRDGTIVDAPPYIVHDFGKGMGGDGLCIDYHGNLYVAAGAISQPHNPPGIYAFSPEGEHLGFMPIPEDSVVSCRFGGWDMRTLYVTAGGGIYQARMPVPGFNTNYYPREEEEKELHVWEDEPPPPTPAPTSKPCPIDERVAENGMLRDRISALEQEIALQKQMVKERDLQLKEIEGLVRRINLADAQPKRRRRVDDYNDQYDVDEDYERRGSGGVSGRRRFADDEYEDWGEGDEEKDSNVASKDSTAGERSGGAVRRTPAVRRAVIDHSELASPNPQRASANKKAHVRQLFERRYDEL